MNWHSVDALMHMGGYGSFVWGAFGMVALLLGVEVALVARRWRRALAAARQPVTGEHA